MPSTSIRSGALLRDFAHAALAAFVHLDIVSAGLKRAAEASGVVPLPGSRTGAITSAVRLTPSLRQGDGRWAPIPDRCHDVLVSTTLGRHATINLASSNVTGKRKLESSTDPDDILDARSLSTSYIHIGFVSAWCLLLLLICLRGARSRCRMFSDQAITSITFYVGVPAGTTAIPGAPAPAPRERSAAIRSGSQLGTKARNETNSRKCHV